MQAQVHLIYDQQALKARKWCPEIRTGRYRSDAGRLTPMTSRTMGSAELPIQTADSPLDVANWPRRPSVLITSPAATTALAPVKRKGSSSSGKSRRVISTSICGAGHGKRVRSGPWFISFLELDKTRHIHGDRNRCAVSAKAAGPWRSFLHGEVLPCAHLSGQLQQAAKSAGQTSVAIKLSDLMFFVSPAAWIDLDAVDAKAAADFKHADAGRP